VLIIVVATSVHQKVNLEKIGTIHVTYALPSALFYLVFTLC
jgi:hypothetical protein